MINWLKRYISLPLLIVMGFLAYVLFFNENSLMKSMDYASEIRELEAKIAQCEDTLRHYEALNKRLDSNPEELERIVREHYHMQRPSEDVYIITVVF
ncbi:MAG: septum formation initiator family protein [Muribaculaceae bacterium]|nr:septum formation initiator family protein [Muribaculaceae bacterium]